MAFTLAEIVGWTPPPAVRPAPVARPRCPVMDKACFPTKAEAVAVARQVNAHEVECNKAYFCDWCATYHLGRRSRRA